jgi:hypothetical protein
MLYQYLMVQVPSNLGVKSSSYQGNEAAQFLQNVVNHHAAQGWEFYRVDKLGIVTTPGCLAALFGAKQLQMEFSVVTFRRPQ